MTARALVLMALLPSAALAYLPNEGVELTVHKGFFTEADVGAMLTVGGGDSYSNAQSFIQLAIGVDLSRHVELGLQVGLGSSNVNCFAQGSAVAGTCTAADSFTMLMADGFGAYLVPLAPRLWLTPRLMAGYTNLDPNPVTAGGHAVYQAFNLGAGVGVEYATSLEHFSVGAEVSARYVFGANIPAIAIAPRVKYTF
jgi:hypothetical protein